MSVHALEIIAGRAYNQQGQVAVLVSTGYGAGWYSWHGNENLLFDPQIVHMVLEGDTHYRDILEYCQRVYGEDNYYGGIDTLEVVWLPRGVQFRIDEYGGAESLILFQEENWITA